MQFCDETCMTIKVLKEHVNIDECKPAWRVMKENHTGFLMQKH